MKKFIAIMLVAIMLFSLASCKEQGPTNTPETLPLNVEMLKADWTKGQIIFPGEKLVAIPCALNEFVEKTGATINSQSMFEGKTLEPKETLSLKVSSSGANIELTLRNTTDEAIGYLDASVVGYSYNNTDVANRQIKFAGTLSPGVVRADVEEALGIPEGRTSADVIYIYEGRNTKNRKIKLTVAFDSYDIVNSVAYEIQFQN